jgi:hypothetical protein
MACWLPPDRYLAKAWPFGIIGFFLLYGIVGIRFTTSTVLQGAAKLVACGTGVKLENRAKNIPDK